MKLATWNVNSVRARLDRLLAWLPQHRPDVLALQELKVADEAFPMEAITALGYRAAIHGQKTYNGVALLSLHPIEDVRIGLGDGEEDPQARLISARIQGIRVLSAYMPNGGEVESDKWAYKLLWMKRMRAHLDRNFKVDEPLALLGDFNVAPAAADVHDPALWVTTPMHHPLAVEGLAHISAFGLRDVVREQRPEPGLYSWWDYRNLGFPKNQGLRIDHVFCTPSLAARCTGASVDRESRKGKQPSDHAPVLAEFKEG